MIVDIVTIHIFLESKSNSAMQHLKQFRDVFKCFSEWDQGRTLKALSLKSKSHSSSGDMLLPYIV